MDNADQPAFAARQAIFDPDDKRAKWYQGLTKREWFAGLAMEGMWANNDVVNTLAHNAPGKESIGVIKKMAYAQADAMLNEEISNEKD